MRKAVLNKIRDRFLTYIILILMILSILPAPVFAAGNREKDTEEIELTVWDFKYTDSTTQRVFSQIDRIFMKQHPGVRIVHRGYNDEDYIYTLKSAMIAGTGPDIFMLHPGAEFTEFSPYAASLDSFVEQASIAFLPGILESTTDDKGTIKALPFSIQGIGFYYNKELFAEAGLDPEVPPETFNDFYAACEALSKAGIIPIATGNNRPLTTDFSRRILTAGYFSDDEIENFFKRGQGIASPEFRKIMDFLLHIRESGWLDPDGILMPYFNYAKDHFAAGKSAIIPGLISDIANWKEFSDKLGTDTVGYFPNLKEPDMAKPGAQLLQSAGIIWSINQTGLSEDQETLAYEYLKVLYSEEVQELLIGQLGMLMPLEDQSLPVDEYPVLTTITEGLEHSGHDLEEFTPSTTVRSEIYRYDKLLINTREIPLDVYIQRLYDFSSLY